MSALLIVQLVAVFTTGLLAGIFFGDRVGNSYARPKLPPSAFVTFQQVQNVRFARMMPLPILAALVASRLAPAAAGYMVASHRSPEPGHPLVLTELGLRPLLDLGLRLGEGSGAALALPLLEAALALLEDMATFESAGVTDAGA